MRLPAILAATVVGLTTLLPANADSVTSSSQDLGGNTSVITTTTDSAPSVAPVVVTPAPQVKKKDKHLLHVGIPFLFHANLF